MAQLREGGDRPGPFSHKPVITLSVEPHCGNLEVMVGMNSMPPSADTMDSSFDDVYANMTFDIDALMSLMNWTAEEKKSGR